MKWEADYGLESYITIQRLWVRGPITQTRNERNKEKGTKGNEWMKECITWRCIHHDVCIIFIIMNERMHCMMMYKMIVCNLY